MSFDIQRMNGSCDVELDLFERRLIEEYKEHNDIVFAWWLKSEMNESREGML